MFIKEIFAKPIDRDIKGVIKVGQDDEDNIRQELEEYVVTKELQKHFAEFFAGYKKGIEQNTDKMGVWISGFFGSGKSHFLKILSYLLDNREAGGKHAMDYFAADEKIADPQVLDNMRLAAEISSDVILFNIDSKSESSGKVNKDAIVSVFLKVFNEMQGFCGLIPALADLERQLQEKGRYGEFKTRFEEEYGDPWEASRHRFDFIQDELVKVLTSMEFMSQTAAWNWCEKATEPYTISIEAFANLVKDYIDAKGGDHHVVFLVDEMGQYIGSDSKLMLNLQTVTEDLGTACKGKAWVIVTSQQDIDAVAKDMGLRSNDFSKIQGRFDTRLSLSSANVDEVIKKRILDKTPVAAETLRQLYDQKATILKNLIVFNDGVEKKLFSGQKDFAEIYPFVPYQFNLLGSVLTSIRTHGASGKHLSEGERSMIAMFQESAMARMDREVGALIPFNLFYDALHQFLDHSHKGVISKALENDYINPDHQKTCFCVDVLKTLFMIKYVKEITANVDNITSLMADHLDTDRIALKEKVQEALNALIRQMLVQKNGEIYVFLTNEEQEINREIENQTVEMGDIITDVSELVFEDIYQEKKYRYPKFSGRYTFAFNQKVDGHEYKANKNYDIGVHVVTPYADISDDETTLRMISGQGNEVLVVLPKDKAFLEEIVSAKKIEKYLIRDASKAPTQHEQIKESKRVEMRERKNNAKIFLIESMKDADIYVNGDKAQIGAKDVASKISEALGRLVLTVYHKLDYITAATDGNDIRNLFRESGQQALALEGSKPANSLAINDVRDFIAANAMKHIKISLKSAMDRFMNPPYGFIDDDVRWIAAKLFRDGDISFILNGEQINLFNYSADEIIGYITNRKFVEKLMMEKREKASESQKRVVKSIMKELFGAGAGLEHDDDAIMRDFQERSGRMVSELRFYEQQYQEKPYPGKAVIKEGKAVLLSLQQPQSSGEFFREVCKRQNDLLDFAEDYEPIHIFFEGEQKNIFDKALSLLKTFEESKTFIVDETIVSMASDMNAIVTKAKPYGDIPRLPELIEKFLFRYVETLEQDLQPIMEAVEAAKNRVLEVLKEKEYQKDMKDHVMKPFAELMDKAQRCQHVAILQNIKVEADRLKVRLLNEFDIKDEQLVRQKAKEAAEKQTYQTKLEDQSSDGAKVAENAEPVPQPKKKKNLSIHSVNTAASWRIESAGDLERYVDELKSKILRELDEDTIVNIEF